MFGFDWPWVSNDNNIIKDLSKQSLEMKTLEHKQHSLRLNSCTIPVELGTKSGLLNSNTCEVYTKKITILSSFLKKLQPNLDQREIFHVSVETLGQTIVETPLRRKDSVNWINGKRSSRNLCHCSVYQRWFEIALLSKVVQSQGVACRQKIRAVKQFFQGQWLCKGQTVVVSQVFLGKNTEAIIYFWLKDS